MTEYRNKIEIQLKHNRNTLKFTVFRLFSLSFFFLLLTFHITHYTSHLLYASQLTAHFIDVGQGDCIFIQTPNGKNILIDGGPEDDYYNAGKEVVLPYLTNLGVKTIDAIIISHAHRDHIGGLLEIIKKIPVAVVYDSGYAYPSPIYEKLLKSISKRNISYIIARAGTKVKLDPAIQISVLSPPRHLPWDDPNNNSVVVRIVYKKISFLFTGDIEADAEDYLVSTYKYDLESNILKVPHHGSRSSSTDDFVYIVNPEVVIIQCGRQNRFKHPHPSVIKRYNDFGCKIYRNDIHGTIVVTTDGSTYKITKSDLK